MKKILVVDDDEYIRHLVKTILAKEGFHLLEAKNGMDALGVFQDELIDLAIVDIMMPLLDGFELTKKIRQDYDIPIILLTAKNQLEDKEKGFSSGTDDYLVKPFEPKELLFRVNALLRRYKKVSKTNIKIGTVLINKKNYEVRIDEKTFILPLKEFELLYVFASHPNQVFSRSQLIEKVWGLDYTGDERTVDVHIKRLRERFSKITDSFTIKTIRGIGYSLEAK